MMVNQMVQSLDMPLDLVMDYLLELCWDCLMVQWLGIVMAQMKDALLDQLEHWWDLWMVFVMERALVILLAFEMDLIQVHVSDFEMDLMLVNVFDQGLMAFLLVLMLVH